MKKTLEKRLKEAPTSPGVYLFRSEKGLLYVGKALNLKKRVRSYFQKSKDLGPKTKLMVKKIKRIDWEETESEIEALLLEADLIKRLKPKYNQRWKDDKTYPLLEVTEEKFPRVRVTRNKKEDAFYFGPYPKLQVRDIKKQIRKVFPFRDCSKAKFERYKKLDRGCIYFDMGLCPGPCFGAISKKDYNQQIKTLIRFLKGKTKGIEKKLGKEMEKASKNKNFEKAARLRDRITALKKARMAAARTYFLEDINILEDQLAQEMESLQKILGLKKPPQKIEAYDVSNTAGEEAVGSMVVFENGRPRKDLYRRFKIRTVEGPDDVSSLKEVLRRRTAYLTGKTTDDESFKEKPDLLLIDGGKGQLNGARSVLKKKEIHVPVASLAKREETLYFYRKGEIKKSLLDKRSEEPVLRFVQRVRDESHRFALSYHKKLRRSSFLEE